MPWLTSSQLLQSVNVAVGLMHLHCSTDVVYAPEVDDGSHWLLLLRGVHDDVVGHQPQFESAAHAWQFEYAHAASSRDTAVANAVAGSRISSVAMAPPCRRGRTRCAMLCKKISFADSPLHIRSAPCAGNHSHASDLVSNANEHKADACETAPLHAQLHFVEPHIHVLESHASGYIGPTAQRKSANTTAHNQVSTVTTGHETRQPPQAISRLSTTHGSQRFAALDIAGQCTTHHHPLQSTTH